MVTYLNMVQNTLLLVGVILVASLYSVSSAPKNQDPSTVINVYPSLKKLRPKSRGSGGGGGGGYGRDEAYAESSFQKCEEEAGCGAAASNLKEVLAKKQDDIHDESEENGESEEDNFKTFKEHKMAKLARLKKAVKGKNGSSRTSEDFEMSPGYLSNFDKIIDKSKDVKDFEVGSKKWTSLHDVLQLIKTHKV